LIGKVAVLEPAGTVMLEATSATSGGMHIRMTFIGEVDEGFRIVILPVIVFPPSVELAESVKDEMAVVAGSTPRVANLVVVPRLAEMSIGVGLVTFVLVILNCPDNSPRGMVMLSGMEATVASELDKITERPPPEPAR
jgi:hypothetical protein